MKSQFGEGGACGLCKTCCTVDGFVGVENANLERPSSPGFIPDLNGVTKRAGVVRGAVDGMGALNGVLNPVVTGLFTEFSIDDGVLASVRGAADKG